MGYPLKRRKETDIQLSILKYLRNIGAYAGKTKTMGVKRGKVFTFDPYLFTGFPDISCFYSGRLYFIECKSAKGVLSPKQKKFQELCLEADIPYVVAHSVDDVVKIIQPEVAFPLR